MKKFLAFITIAALALTGCSGCKTTVDPAGNKTTELSPIAKEVLSKAGKVLGSVLVDSLASAASQQLSDGRVDSRTTAFAVANSLWSNINRVNSGGDVGALAMGAGEKPLPQIAVAAAKAFDESANPDPKAKTNAIAAVVSTLAGAPPAPATVK